MRAACPVVISRWRVRSLLGSSRPREISTASPPVLPTTPCHDQYLSPVRPSRPPDLHPFFRLFYNSSCACELRASLQGLRPSQLRR